MQESNPKPEINIPHSVACERNQGPILEVLSSYIKANSDSNDQRSFLEIGHGTGQHALHFAKHFKDLKYIAADQKSNHPHFQLRVEHSPIVPNLDGPYHFHANENDIRHNLPLVQYNYIYSANTLHIMSWKEAQTLLKKIPSLLKEEGQLFLYGPFKIKDQFTSPSNASFDQSLKSRDPQMGIRDFEVVEQILKKFNLELLENRDMPANNQLLIFQKIKNNER